MIRKLIYQLGTLFYNSDIFRNYDFLINSQYKSIQEIQNYQYEKLKELLDHAYKYSQYYRNKFDRIGIDPDQIKTLDDLSEIPVVTKQEILENFSSIQNENISEKMFYSETSGSTGKPLVFYRNKDWDAWHRASVLRGYSWYGIKPWERNGYFWGFNFTLKRRMKTRFLDYLQNQFRLFSYKDADIRKFIMKLDRATYLEGYSSMIYEVAKRINANSRMKLTPDFKMVKGTSEKIFARYQEEVMKAFNQKIISEYGAAEAGIIAFECPRGNMHINMETVIVEEENNEIIVTNLVSKSFPIIRYKLGDYIEIDTHTKCKCGMRHYIIKEVMGRVGKVIYGRVNQYPSLMLYYVFKNLAIDYNIILNYQAIQYEKGVLELNIEQDLNNKERDLLKIELNNYYGEDIAITLLEGKNIISKNKKKSDFVSHIE